MDLFRRAFAQTDAVSSAATVPRGQKFTVLAWRRLVRRILLITEAAFFQHYSSELLALADVDRNPERRSSATAASSAGPVPSSGTRPHEDPGFTFIRGPRRKDSRMKGKELAAFDKCSHPQEEIIHGGNGAIYWETCKMCHGQWERIPVKKPSMPKARLASPATASKTRAPNHLPTSVPAAPECPVCGNEMILRRNNTDGSMFWGCKSYPGCRKTLRFEIGGERVTTSSVPPPSNRSLTPTEVGDADMSEDTPQTEFFHIG
jgi:hypothetical protein